VSLLLQAASAIASAPAPIRKKENAIVSGLSDVGAVVGGFLGGRRGERAGGAVGGAAGTVYVSSEKGREVTLPERASLSVETAERTTITRPRRLTGTLGRTQSLGAIPRG
jgi:uncharacterized protein YcfJ